MHIVDDESKEKAYIELLEELNKLKKLCQENSLRS